MSDNGESQTLEAVTGDVQSSSAIFVTYAEYKDRMGMTENEAKECWEKEMNDPDNTVIPHEANGKVYMMLKMETVAQERSRSRSRSPRSSSMRKTVVRKSEDA